MTRPTLVVAALVAAALLPSGCDRTPPPVVEAEGVVTLNGKPLPNAEVQFVPMAPGFGAEVIATAVTDETGRFRLTCMGKPGACACENKVTVSEGPMPEDTRAMSAAAQVRATKFLAGLKNRPIPERYTTLAQTPLTVTVTPDRREYDLELTR